jgi:hypothetical protein
MAKKPDAPFVVDLPNASADQPSWLRVGMFAVVGLVVGIGWPRVFGIRLGPSAPVAASEAQSGARPSDPPPALPANVVAASPSANGVNPQAAAAVASNATSVDSNTSTVEVKRGVVISCKTDTGETLKGAACGGLDFDAIALPRLKRLSHCPTADGADGKLSVLFGLDFESNKVRIDVGRSTTIENKDTFGVCLNGAFDKVSLGAMAHDNQRYTVSYSVRFAPRGSVQPATAGGAPVADNGASTGTGSSTPAAPVSPTADVAGDTAQVVWEVAIVRDTPRTGQVVARLQRGTAVKLAEGKEGWYRVKYGASFNSEGWVYRGAVGK